MPFARIDFEDIIGNIVDEVFLDKTDEEGVYDYDSLPKNFTKLALVSRNFVNPVRRNLYADLKIEGPERFLLLTGQLRFSPHLARLVKRASLSSACSERTHIDGYQAGTPGDGEPRTVSITAFRWFLNACPQLSKLELWGGDFLFALSSRDITKSVAAGRLTDIELHECNHCRGDCSKHMPRGWLKHIIALPGLKELDINQYGMDGPGDPTFGLPRASSSCSGLSISCMNKIVSPDSLSTLLKSMLSLKELVLDGLRPMPRGALKKCLANVASTLTLLALTDYHSSEQHPQPWENNTVSALQQLKTLSFNGVPVTAPLFDMLPPRLEHLRFASTAVKFLPAPTIAAWLRRERFPLRGILKKLEFVGDLRADNTKRGPKASDAQVAEIARLCHGLGIEWIHEPDQDYSYDLDAHSYDFDASDLGGLNF
ncbi:hypothetical protein C8J57DRAFT_1302309 [Mycena rebaudengoi]|nr:hypothetical protein C8J57DRAFT_1302309 [Mycena rebaudengoi]